MASSLTLGAKTTITATFRDESGTLADPTTVTVRVKDPEGAEVVTETIDLDHPSTGIYSLEVDLPTAGLWRYRVEGAGALVAVEEGAIDVRTAYYP